VYQRETKRTRAIVQLQHDVKRRLQNVIIDTFRRRHALRPGTCLSDDVITESHHCPPSVVKRGKDTCLVTQL